MAELVVYRRKDESEPFTDWLESLDGSAAGRVDTYVRRMEDDNFGNSKAVGEGVIELKIDFGPGYRVYYGRDGERIVLLLTGGTKRRQNRDIAFAQELWAEYLERKD